MYTQYSSKPTHFWILVYGVTSGITNDISNITSHNPYTGEDKAYIDDGKGLSIHNVGCSSLSTHKTSFKLNDVLHVPQVKHNLLYAYQFLKDNYCSLTLNLNGSIINDHFTRRCFCGDQLEMVFINCKVLLHSNSKSDIVG